MKKVYLWLAALFCVASLYAHAMDKTEELIPKEKIKTPIEYLTIVEVSIEGLLQKKTSHLTSKNSLPNKKICTKLHQKMLIPTKGNHLLEKSIHYALRLRIKHQILLKKFKLKAIQSKVFLNTPNNGPVTLEESTQREQIDEKLLDRIGDHINSKYSSISSNEKTMFRREQKSRKTTKDLKEIFHLSKEIFHNVTEIATMPGFVPILLKNLTTTHPVKHKNKKK